MEDEARSSLDPRIAEVRSILWGNNVTNDIFQRWSQGKTYVIDYVIGYFVYNMIVM